MERPEIHFEDLLIRPWQPSDVEAVYQACQDPEISRWIPLPRPYEMSHAVHLVDEISPVNWANRTGANFGVFDAASGELLANMALVRMDLAAKRAELGFWTAPGARGRGVVVRAGRAVATWAFDALELHRLIWRADLGNHLSRLVALRMGFVMEGISRGAVPAVDGSGQLVDVWVGAMRPGDVTPATPASLAPGSPTAKRAHTFYATQPTLPMPGGALRPLGEADIDAATVALQDPETLRWTTVPPDYQRENAEWFITRHAVDSWLQGTVAVYGIVDPDDAYCGGIDLRISADDPAVGEIGFHVAPWARGRGLAPAAARTIANWGFEALGLERIVWRAHVGNEASKRVAEKAGFVIEGIARDGCGQRGERRDAWVGAMLAADPR